MQLFVGRRPVDLALRAGDEAVQGHAHRVDQPSRHAFSSFRATRHRVSPVTPTASRAVLVTGASRGIGAAVARAFAASGDRVAVHYGSRREQALQVAASLPGEGHVVAGADLGDPDAVRRMVAEAAEALGGVDVLVNN